jgi:sulfite oxidase
MDGADARFGKHPRLIVRQEEPLNAGPPPDLLCAAELTPYELFYVRNHGGVPRVDPQAFRLEVGGLARRTLALALDDLRRLGEETVEATLECAGNRRSEMAAVAPIPGELPWGEEAIGNARWTGVPLARLLDEAGVEKGARHVAFSGLDDVERGGRRFGFGGSIPLEKARAPEVLLAWEMNGAPLPPVHGAPLRALVPGYIGARSVKWLAKVTLQEEPSDNYFQAKAYRLFPPHVTAETVDWKAGRMLEDIGLNAVICAPLAGERVAAGKVEVRGWAVAGGGRRVARVEVSGDGGRSWKEAELEGEGGENPRGRDARDRSPWVWRLFRAGLDLSPGEREIAVRAWDTAGETQPQDPAGIWNFKGYMHNAWHRVRVTAA